MSNKNKTFDITIFGATSFVGQILTAYMVSEYGVSGDVNWAIAGRSENKLNDLKKTLTASELPSIIANADDASSLSALCEQSRVIISTVGPYALYGEAMVKACVETGTDYCDLTGEVQWIKAMLDKYQTQATTSGARIVNCCGFDSIPSDMGVYFLQQQAQKKFNTSCSSVKMRTKALKGGMSGGTVASMTNIAKEAVSNKQLRRDLANPYLLCAKHEFSQRQTDINFAQKDSDFDSWLAPFIMASINSRIVHRSNFLSNYAYGKNFTYNEAMMTGKGFKGAAIAHTVTMGIGAFLAGAALKPTRYVLEKFFLPKPGEGPTPEAQESGFWDIRFLGKTAAGDSIKVKVTGDKDPGYGSTAKMLAQAGLSLAFDVKSPHTGGFWTTASLFDDAFIKRLESKADLKFQVI